MKLAATAIVAATILGMFIAGIGIAAAALIVTYVDPPEGMHWAVRTVPGPFGPWGNVWSWAASITAVAFFPSMLMQEWRKARKQRRTPGDPMTSDLVAFVRARLDEDEQAAQPAAEDAEQLDEWQNAFDAPRGRFAPHLRRHTPARVLAQVAAMRRIVDQAEFSAEFGPPSGAARGVDTSRAQAVLHDSVRALAAIWSDHPDYRQEWTP